MNKIDEKYTEDAEEVIKAVNELTQRLLQISKKRIRKKITWWILMEKYKHRKITWDEVWEIYNKKYYQKEV